MRLLAALLIALAGCAQPAPPIDVAEPLMDVPAGPSWDRLGLMDGRVEWHDDGSPTAAYAQVAQAIAHPCIYDGGREIYFTNQVLGAARIPNGTTHLAITFDWDDTTYLRDALRVGYRLPSEERYAQSLPFARGEEMVLGVSVEDWADPTETWGGGAELWACLDTDTGDGLVPPSVFKGELRYKVEAIA